VTATDCDFIKSDSEGCETFELVSNGPIATRGHLLQGGATDSTFCQSGSKAITSVDPEKRSN
jgi:hypothetical protein